MNTTNNITAELARLNELDAKRTQVHPGFLYSRGGEKYWKEASPEFIALANKLHGLLVRAEVALATCSHGMTEQRFDAAMVFDTLTAIRAAGIGGA